MAKYKPQSRRIPPPSRTQPALRFAGVLVLFLSIGYALWLAVSYSNSTTSSWTSAHSFSPETREDVVSGPAQRPLLSSSILSFAEPAPGNAAPLGRMGPSEFSRAFNRLDQALRARGKADPDQTLASANAQAKNEGSGAESRPCPIAWNDGEPSLLLAEHSRSGLSLPATLDRCSRR